MHTRIVGHGLLMAMLLSCGAGCSLLQMHIPETDDPFTTGKPDFHPGRGRALHAGSQAEAAAPNGPSHYQTAFVPRETAPQTASTTYVVNEKPAAPPFEASAATPSASPATSTETPEVWYKPIVK